MAAETMNGKRWSFAAEDEVEWTPETIVGMMVYGPARTLRGRIRNRLRRLLRMEERDEVYGYWRNIKDYAIGDGDKVLVKFGNDGVIYYFEER